jgi:RimJ/RimL family protein N-acetyltransferase
MGATVGEPSNPRFPEAVDTEHLHLRRWRPDDRDAYASIWADPDVWQSLRAGQPGDRAAIAAEAFERQLRHWEEHGYGVWAAVDRSSDEIAGWLGAAHPTFIPELSDEIEIGWVLARPFWGRGLATEGARAARDNAVAHLSPPRLISLILPTNSRSIAVAERLGMTPAELPPAHASFAAKAAQCETVTHPELGVDLRVYELPRGSAGVV